MKICKLSLILIIFCTSCRNTTDSFPKELTKIFKEKSINRNQINWEKFEYEITQAAKISRDSAIVKALSINNNPHSYYLKGNKLMKGNYFSVASHDSCFASGRVNDIFQVGYIDIRSYDSFQSENSRRSSIEYVKKNINTIKKYNKHALKRWIIDLRYNRGGDMWPMLISLSPFFTTNTTLGYFKNDRATEQWQIKNGDIFLDSQSINQLLHIDNVNFKVSKENTKIAVLINQRTASAGEATAIALKAIKNVRFFGQKTKGFATSNEKITIRNGETLILTVSLMADNHKNIYLNGINPDVKTCSGKDLNIELKKWFEER